MSNNSHRTPRQPKPVTSLRHNEEHLAKVAGFTPDQRKGSEKREIDADEWEHWRGHHGTQLERKDSNATSAIVIWGIGLVCVAGIGVVVWLIVQSASEVPMESLTAEPRKGQPTLPQTVGLSSEEIAQRFLDAKTVEERLQWTRNPERVAPLMMADEASAKVQEEVLSLRPFGKVIVQNGFFYEKFHVITSAGDRLLAICETSDGRRADWECYVRYCPVSWRDFLNLPEGSDASDFRVFVAATDFRTDIFPETDYTFFKIESPDLTADVYAFVKRGDDLEDRLSRLSGAGRSTLEKPNLDLLPTTPGLVLSAPVRAMLTLKPRTGTSRSRIVEIIALKHLGWVTP